MNDSSLKEQKKILSEIYEKQKANGGIIDVEAEKTKFLLNISAVSDFRILPSHGIFHNLITNIPSL